MLTLLFLGDLIKRAYWTCILSEDFYHLDLDLPRTGIDQLVRKSMGTRVTNTKLPCYVSERKAAPKELCEDSTSFSSIVLLRRPLPVCLTIEKIC